MALLVIRMDVLFLRLDADGYRQASEFIVSFAGSFVSKTLRPAGSGALGKGGLQP